MTNISATSGVAPSMWTGNANGTPNTKADLGKDAFLNLLVAQLKYQDPTSPMDSSQFLAQTAQFTLVEKMEALAAQSETQLSTSQLQAATAMVGRRVTWTAEDGGTLNGTVSGVTLTSGSPKLMVDGFEVDLAAVTKVTNPSS